MTWLYSEFIIFLAGGFFELANLDSELVGGEHIHRHVLQ